MQSETKRLPKGLVELAVTVSPDELRPFLERAAASLAEISKLEGFRPGKAPYALVAARVGEAKIYEAAAESVVHKTYPAAAREHAIKAVGEPSIAITLLAPGNPFAFTATVPVLPEVTRLADYRGIRVEKKLVAVTEADLERALRDLQHMQTRESEVDRASTAADKMVVNVAMSRDRVPIEGGAARGHQVYLAEPYYVPGFSAAITGLKKGDKKSFSLSFPTDHYQKSLAGKSVDFEVEVASVVELTPPPLNDAFAATLGQASLEALRALLQRNLEAEATQKETQRQEISALEQLVNASTFEDVPEVMVNTESERMLGEIEEDVRSRGLSFDDYLSSIKKSRVELKLGFTPQAVRRIKTALAVREVAEREQIAPSDQEVADEVARRVNEYAKSAEAQAEAKTQEYADAVRIMLRNRKVVTFLRNGAAAAA